MPGAASSTHDVLLVMRTLRGDPNLYVAGSRPASKTEYDWYSADGPGDIIQISGSRDAADRRILSPTSCTLHISVIADWGPASLS